MICASQERKGTEKSEKRLKARRSHLPQVTECCSACSSRGGVAVDHVQLLSLHFQKNKNAVCEKSVGFLGSAQARLEELRPEKQRGRSSFSLQGTGA